MAIRKMEHTRPIRKWGIFGRYMVGKSSFVACMRQPILLYDFDHRFEEVVRVYDANVFKAGDHDDSMTPLELHEWTLDNREEIRRLQIGTVVVDSITPYIKQQNAHAMESNKAGRNKNQMSAFVQKSNAMTLLQDSVISLGVDVAFLWHLENHRDDRGNLKLDHSLQSVERDRLMRNLNAMIGLAEKDGVRGAKIVWSRSGNAINQLVRDTEGYWRGVPEKIDELILPSAASSSVPREASA